MTGDNQMPLWMMITDKLRGIETTLTDQRRQHDAQERKITAMHDCSAKLSANVSQIGAQVTAIAAQMETIISWGKRILLGLGLALLSSQHLTIDQLARLIKLAFGL